MFRLNRFRQAKRNNPQAGGSGGIKFTSNHDIRRIQELQRFIHMQVEAVECIVIELETCECYERADIEKRLREARSILEGARNQIERIRGK